MKKILLCTFLVSSLFVFAHKDRWDAHQESWSPLMLSIYKGKTNKFLKLLQQNADVNYVAPNTLTLTALDVAIRVNNEKAILALLETKKIKSLNESLFTAAAGENASIVVLLLRHVANPNALRWAGHTVLSYAIGSGSIEVVESLLHNGAAINQANSNGMTPLIMAGYGSKVEKIKLLMQHGADKNPRDARGFTALEYFNKYCDLRKVSDVHKAEIRELLQE